MPSEQVQVKRIPVGRVCKFLSVLKRLIVVPVSYTHLDVYKRQQVPNYGKRGYGTLLKKGMCIAIEPMITLGSRQIVMERDGWTVRTRDRKCAAHFEHTVAIGVGKADILSLSLIHI